jgi:hypothetical protein
MRRISSSSKRASSPLLPREGGAEMSRASAPASAAGTMTPLQKQRGQVDRERRERQNDLRDIARTPASSGPEVAL